MKIIKGLIFAIIGFICLISAIFMFYEPQAHAVEAKCPAGLVSPAGSNPDPNWLVCEDFELKTWFPSKGGNAWHDFSEYCCDYLGAAGIIYPPSEETEAVACGSTPNVWGKVWTNITGFGGDPNSPCTAWNGAFQGTSSDGAASDGWNGHYGEISFPASSEMYFRWYSYYGFPYTAGTVQDKDFRVRSNGKSPSNINVFCVSMTLLATRYGGMRPAFLDFSGGDVDLPQNQGNNLTLNPPGWYLYEMYVKLNTPGSSDGIVRVWIDDASVPITTQTLRIQYTNVKYRSGTESCLMQHLELPGGYHQKGRPPAGMHNRWDNIVVSRVKIGPMGGVVITPLLPAAVTGLGVL